MLLRNLSAVVFLLISLLTTSCGQMPADSVLRNYEFEAVKTRCSGDHDGFYVCLSDDSQAMDPAFLKVIERALVGLPAIVNSAGFQRKIESAFAGGTDIVAAIRSTNYIAKITSFCDENTTALARALVGGDEIYFNECKAERDETGRPDFAKTSGTLMHEIMHNVGYEHPERDPKRTSVPYWVGDLVQRQIESEAPGTEKPAGVQKLE